MPSNLTFIEAHTEINYGNKYTSLAPSDGETNNVVLETLIYQEFSRTIICLKTRRKIELLSEKLQGAEMELAKLNIDN